MSTVQLKETLYALLIDKTVEQLNEDKQLNEAMQRTAVEWLQAELSEGKLTVDEMFNGYNNTLVEVLTELDLLGPAPVRH